LPPLAREMLRFFGVAQLDAACDDYGGSHHHY